MQVTRDIVLDLFPTYLSGEASPATKAFVEDYMKSDPEFAAQLRQQWSDAAAGLPVSPELELRSLSRTRQLMSMRGWLLGLAIFLTLLPGSHASVNGKVYAFSAYFPVTAIVILVAAVGCWIAWFVVRRKLKFT